MSEHDGCCSSHSFFEFNCSMLSDVIGGPIGNGIEFDLNLLLIFLMMIRLFFFDCFQDIKLILGCFCFFS